MSIAPSIPRIARSAKPWLGGGSEAATPSRDRTVSGPTARGAQMVAAQPVRLPEPVDRAGHRDGRERPTRGDGVEPAVRIERGRREPGRRPAGGQRVEAAGPGIPAEPEAVAAEPGHVRVDDRERGPGGDGGVDGGP